MILGSAMAEKLSVGEVDAYQRDGYLIRRDSLTEADITRLEKGFARNPPLDGTLYDVKQLSYPEPGRYTLANNSLKDPDLGFIVEHPEVVGPAAQLLGDEPRLTAYVLYDRTPGGPAIGSHNDYKRWRPVGSSMNWLFTIMPFCDFDDEAGPLYIAPGSHHLERVTPGSERPLEVDPPTRPPESDFIDPELKRGDVLFMNMHLWHKAAGNNSGHHRVGLFNKYCAASCPPATGYLLYDDDVHAMLSPERQDLLGVHSNLSIDTTRVLLMRETRQGPEVFLRQGAGGLEFPGGPSFVEQAIPDWDRGNYIASAQAALREQIQVETPWLSYVADHVESGPAEGGSLARIYAYTLTGRGFPVGYNGEWLTRYQLVERSSELAHGYEAEALDAWLDPALVRGKGLTQAQSRVDQYAY
ncbi:MAG: hypothetical protein ACI8Y4_004098 [Candidatus Poriferisodalaceae bacterium]